MALPSTNLSGYAPMPASTVPLVSASDPSFMDVLGGNAGGILDSIGTLGGLLGKQAQGDNAAAVDQGQLNNAFNNSQIGLYGAQQTAQNQAANLDLERQAFTTNNRAANAKQALLASLLGSFH